MRWHSDADQPHSSQVFCVSAFGTLRRLLVRDLIVRQLLGLPFVPNGDDTKWAIELEASRPDLLSEYGGVQPSSIDVLLRSQQAVVCVEAKFWKDAKAGFSWCSQPKRDKDGQVRCAGYYGPGSDLKTRSSAWCRLEIWDGGRSPRTYWALGKAFFRDGVFAKQSVGQTCPFNGPHYQLMRNFLFAAALAQRQRLASFGVVVIAPARKSGKLEQQVESFRTTVLQPQFSSSVQFVTYERLIELLRHTGETAAIALADFLGEQITNLIL